jgi:hypothetical protein
MSRPIRKENNMENLLNCIAHGTSVEEFLSTFASVEEAARHLRDFYENAVEEIEEDELDALELATRQALQRYA